MSRTTIVKDLSAITGSTVALSGGATFGVVLLGMHVLKPEIAPSWRFISEYALGEFGWLMRLAFLAFAVAHLGLVVSLHRLVFRSLSARLGLGALALSGAGFALAGVFPTDPVTLDPHLATTAGKLHAFGGALGMAMPMAVAFVSWSLIGTGSRRGPRSGRLRRSPCWARLYRLRPSEYCYPAAKASLDRTCPSAGRTALRLLHT